MPHNQVILFAAGLLLVGLSSCSSSPTNPADDPNNQTVPTTCEPSNTIELAVGEFAEFRGNAAALVCMRSNTAHASYVLVATSAATSGPPSSTFTFQATGTTAAITPPAPVVPEGSPAALALGLDAGLVEDFGFHVRIRDEFSTALPQISSGEGNPSQTAPEFLPAAAPPSVGELLSLNAQSASGQQCTNPINVVGRVQVVSNHAIVVADTANPASGFTASDYQNFANFFDSQISPLTEEYFGEVTDIDNNDRTILFFTKEVNRLTQGGSSSYVGGFFHPRDLLSKATCSTSNAGEILYLMVPDPTGAINGNPRTVSFVLGVTSSTMVHEQQHLINSSRRYHVLQLTGDARNEKTWLNEGLSHLAEELLFYRMSGREPETNLSLIGLGSRIQELNAYQASNFQRMREYLFNPSSTSPYHSTDGLDTRGASWSFLRYVVDRQPLGHAQFLRELVSSRTTGIDNLSDALGGGEVLASWLSDWGVAIYADDRVANSSDRHRLRSWNQPTLINSLLATSTLGAECIPVPQSSSAYPICTRALTSGTTLNQSLVQGGSAYFRFGLDGGTSGRVKVTPTGGGIAPPSTLRLTLLRTR